MLFCDGILHFYCDLLYGFRLWYRLKHSYEICMNVLSHWMLYWGNSQWTTLIIFLQPILNVIDHSLLIRLEIDFWKATIYSNYQQKFRKKIQWTQSNLSGINMLCWLTLWSRSIFATHLRFDAHHTGAC